MGMFTIGSLFPRYLPPDWEGTMRLFGFGFLSVWLLLAAPMAITVAETVQGVAPDTTQSLPQPILGFEDDLLNLLD
jgi:hypothetical protein